MISDWGDLGMPYLQSTLDVTPENSSSCLSRSLRTQHWISIDLLTRLLNEFGAKGWFCFTAFTQKAQCQCKPYSFLEHVAFLNISPFLWTSAHPKFCWASSVTQTWSLSLCMHALSEPHSSSGSPREENFINHPSPYSWSSTSSYMKIGFQIDKTVL